MALTTNEVRKLYFMHTGFIPSGSPTTADFVTDYYQRTVGRAPDPEGLNYWVNELDSGILPTANFGSAFSNAVQTVQKYTDMVDQAYASTPGAVRDPKPEDKQYWIDQLKSGNLTEQNFQTAFKTAVDQINRRNQRYTDMVDQAYASTPGAVRDPKGEDKQYWIDQLKSGNLTEQNFQTTFKASVDDVNRNFVKDHYQRTLGRAPDPEGLDYWANELNSGNLPTANFGSAFSNAVQDHQKYADMVDKAYANTPGAVWDPKEEDKLYWINQLKSGNLTEQNFQTTFKASVDEYNSRNPQEPPPTPDRVTPTTPTTGLDDLFQPDKFPSSGSTSTSRSGLPDWFNKPLLEGLLPTLQESIKNLPGQVDQWAEKNTAASRSAAKNMLDGHLTSLLADLSKRGLTNSSVASDAVGQAGLNAARMQSGVDLGIMGQADQQKMQIPGLLAGIAGLGQTSTSESTSHSSNPLAPYELYSQMLLGMM